jgi:hypothetical protein
MYYRRLQLVPYFRPVRASHSDHHQRLPLPHELPQQLPKPVLQHYAPIRHLRYVHIGLFLLLVRD